MFNLRTWTTVRRSFVAGGRGPPAAPAATCLADADAVTHPRPSPPAGEPPARRR